MTESEEELKSLIVRVKEESEKPGLKLNIKKNQGHGIQCHHFMEMEAGKVEAVADFIFLGSKITADGDSSHEIKRHLLFGRKAMTNLDSILKNRHHFANKGPYSQSDSFSSSQVQMWELDHKEGWALKNWCFQVVVLEKTLESPLGCKKIKPSQS